MRKRVLTLLLALMMIVSLLPVSSMAAIPSSGSTGTYSIVSTTEYAIAPGVTEYDVLFNTTAGDAQNRGFVMEIDPAQPTLKLRAGYKNYTGSSWGMQTPTLQAQAAETYLKNNGDPNANVVGVINANFFNMSTGEPVGALVMNGTKWHDTTPGWGYIAVLADGTVQIRDGSTPLDDVVEAMGGREFLVRGGSIAVPAGDNGEGRLPRAAAGVTSEGKVILFQVDGRQAPKSHGMTIYELAQTMLTFGCVDALNLDGGGSATFMTEREGTGALTVKNSPSDGYERAVSGTLLVVSSADPNGGFTHASIAPNGEYYTPGSTVQFTAFGVNDSGAQVDMPDGLTYALANDAMGTITADGEFTANETEGEVVVQLKQGDTVVGSTRIYIRQPDKVEFMNESVNLKYEQTSDLGFVATYNNIPLNIKDGDFIWDIVSTEGNGTVGSFSGNTFIASPNNDAHNLSVEATVKATSGWNDAVNATVKVSVGKEPVVVMDGGDADGKNYNNVAYVHANANGGGLAYETHANDHGDVVVVHYINGDGTSRGGIASAEQIDIDSGEVRFGQKALRLDYDFRNINGIEGACVGFDKDVEIPGNPTGIGVWLYAPPYTPNLWVRIRVKDGSGTVKTLNFTTQSQNVGLPGDDTLLAEWNIGTLGGINWVGWKYIECDLSNVPGPITLMGGETVRIMDTNGGQGDMGQWVCQKDATGEVVYGGIGDNALFVGHQKGYLYLDNLQLVYGTNNADIDNPVIRKIQVGPSLDTAVDIAADGSTVINSNHVTFYSEFADVENELSAGLDFGYIYVDGVNMSSNENFVSNINDGKMILNDMLLANGTHTLTVLVHDGYGNEAKVTRSFTVDGSDADLTEVNLEATSDKAPLGGVYQLELASNKLDDVAGVNIVMDVQNAVVSGVTFVDDYAGSTFAVNGNELTINAVRKDGATSAGEGNIAVISLQVPPDVERGSFLIYSASEGSVTYVVAKDDNVINTFALPEARIPIEEVYTLTAGVVIRGGADAEITVVDQTGAPASGVSVYLDGTAEALGVTGADGKLTVTGTLNALTSEFKLYAAGEAGYSFRTKATPLPAAGSDDGKPYYILENATQNAFSTKSLSWMANPLVADDAAIVRYALKSAYDAGGELNETVTGTSMLYGFTDYAARLNNATITGLNVNTEYAYQVGDGEIWSEVRTFDTIDNDVDSKTKMFIVGDTQTAVGETDNITKINEYLISKPGANQNNRYSLGIQLGDAVEEPTLYHSWQGFLGAIQHENGAFDSTDMLHVIGNHEQFNDPPATAAKQIFTIDPGRTYYSVTYGNVYVATFDFTMERAPVQEACAWLVADAQASSAPWKILVLHQPPYYTNPEGGGGNLHELLPPAVDQAGINFVFSGHDHSYARTEPLYGGQVDEAGTYYYICGSTGEKAYGVVNNPDFHFHTAQQDYNAIFLTIEATDSEIDVNTYDLTDYSDTNGTPYYYMLIDAVHLSKYTPCSEGEHEWVYRPGRDLLLCEKCHTRLNKAEYSGFAKMEGTEDSQVYMIDGVLQTGWIPVGEDMYYAGDDYIVHLCTITETKTCTVGGYNYYYCAEYDVSKRSESYMYPNGHVWQTDESGEYVLNENGHRVCSVCGHEGIPLDEVEFNFGSPEQIYTAIHYNYNADGVYAKSFGRYDGRVLEQSSGATLVQGEDGGWHMRDLYMTWINPDRVGYASVHYEGKGDFYGEYDLVYVIHPARVQNLTVVTTSTSSVTLSWDAAGGAEYYEVYQTKEDGSNVKKYGPFTDTTAVIGDLKSNQTYYFKVIGAATVEEETLWSTKYSDIVSATTIEPVVYALTDLYATVDGQEIRLQNVDGADYLFLPGSADLSALDLDITFADYSGEITLKGGKGSAAVGETTDITSAADAKDGKYQLSVITDGATSATFTLMQASEMPVIYLTSDDAENAGREFVDASKDNAVTGSMKMFDASGNLLYDDALTQIKARGNTTFYNADKKSYQIKLAAKSDLLGTGEKVKTWVLLAGFHDATKIHDKTVKDLAASLGMDYVASSDWVTVYYDGEFRGIYQLGEKNSVGSTSVDITDLEDAYEAVNEGYGENMTIVEGTNSYGQTIKYTSGLTEPEDISGGYLIEMNGVKIDEASGFMTKQGRAMNVKSPEWAGEDAMRFISEYYQEFEDAVYATDEDGNHTGYNAETGKYYYEYVDKDSLVKFFLLRELTCNVDAFYSSTFFYMDQGGMMFIGPIWDQEIIFGTGWNKHISYNSASNQYMDGALIQIPDFKEAVCAYYEETFVDAAKALAGNHGVLAENSAAVRSSVLMDNVLWPFVYIGKPDVTNHLWADGTTYDDVIADLLDWVSKRISVLDERYGNGSGTEPTGGDEPSEPTKPGPGGHVPGGDPVPGGDDPVIPVEPGGDTPAPGGDTPGGDTPGGDTPGGDTPGEPSEIENPFIDVKEDDFFFDAVLWAVQNGITNGTTETTFEPNATCNRAQVVTFLYRVFGEPEVTGDMPFEDVASDSWYYKAVLWAVQNGITNGIDATHFGPDLDVTRGQVVTFMYRAVKASAPAESVFADVDEDAFYAAAVNWAAENGVTLGVGNNLFAPDDDCTRGQVVTFLFRYFGKE